MATEDYSTHYSDQDVNSDAVGPHNVLHDVWLSWAPQTHVKLLKEAQVMILLLTDTLVCV